MLFHDPFYGRHCAYAELPLHKMDAYIPEPKVYDAWLTKKGCRAAALLDCCVHCRADKMKPARAHKNVIITLSR